MGELENRIARLRYILATVRARETEVAGLAADFARQQARVADYILRDSLPLDTVLAMMDEAETRKIAAESTRRHLEMLRSRVELELDSLVIFRAVDEARRELDGLREEAAEIGRRLSRQTDAELEAKQRDLAERIADLEQRIADASNLAAAGIEGTPSRAAGASDESIAQQ